MSIEWEIVESGPVDADQTVLLLPGGMCSARSYAEVMREPALARTRLVAVTMPGQAGAPAPDSYSVEHYAQITAEFAAKIGADVVAGFSMGATIAYEMAVTGAFAGPVVLLGVSLSGPDEPGFFRAIIRLGSVLGTLPVKVLKKGAASMLKNTDLPAERKAELRADFARNSPSHVLHSLRAYLRWLHRDDDPAARLCAAGVPTWVLHAERGDGGLTEHERAVLERCPQVHLVTLPGAVMFLPNEAPGVVAQLVADALAAA